MAVRCRKGDGLALIHHQEIMNQTIMNQSFQFLLPKFLEALSIDKRFLKNAWAADQKKFDN